MPVMHPLLQFLDGTHVRVPLSKTPKEVHDLVAAHHADKFDMQELVILVNGEPLVTDSEASWTMTLEEVYGQLTTICVSKRFGRTLNTVNDKSRDQKEINVTCLSPTHVVRGYMGHVPGKKFAHGIAECTAHEGNQQPQHVTDTESLQAKRDEHSYTLGYKGFVAASQHVRGTQFTETLKVAYTEDAQELAEHSFMPPSPNKKKCKLESRPEYLELMKP